jgi:hypothetical protein
MFAVLTQNGLKKALLGKSKKAETMSEDEWNEMDDKALTAIQLNLSNDVIQEFKKFFQRRHLQIYG